MDINEKLEKLEKLALDVIKLSRNTLVVNLRFLDMALSVHRLHSTSEISLATDGEYIAYNPLHILHCYREAKENPVRDYLHMVMHCVYRHMYLHALVDTELWSIACDIAVENVITELDIKSACAPREQKQTRIISELKKELNLITAEKVYRYFLDNPPSAQKLNEIKDAFTADDHFPWYMPPEGKASIFGYKTSASADEYGDENGDGNGNGDGRSDKGISSHISISAAEQMWSDISERMQLDLETFNKLKGDRAGAMTQNLREVNREKYDYTAFLKKFAVMGEAMKINDDEFDYIFYTYGLKLYDKMPLIEPLEYKDVKRIKEFVIAIDTSGSTSGELVQKFVQKTYNILKSTESFFSKINLHIIQCDAEIQEDVKITCQEEFDEYLKTMKIHGLGGTDFRPVFKYVNTLIKNKEFTNLKGLIYFTDGYGDFPAQKPDYDTAFVFVDDEFNNPEVPAWAIKLVLQKEEI